ncbi:polysaccharide pyruvyl transferase family protein [Sphingobacterium sp. GVS05A]|uniref:polysaccharide pyruvyl transferase family protein n=1 Tax=Sphingobacterium TaxID=28453 RepID=UPI001CBB1DC6|nr:polysaccharide pyruvyl transferase family protein [Sphingobacterium sp. GVS05A]
MNLYFWNNGDNLNFGDVINLKLWPKMFSHKILSNNNINFLGIGTVLNHLLPQNQNFVVFGSGYGYGKIPDKLTDMDIYCVRGPLTSKKLGLSINKSVTDPAVLLPTVFDIPQDNIYKYGFMPHWQNSNPIWAEICNKKDILYIDPLDNFDSVIKKINSVECLITEAMHGAIVADSYRIPWIPVCDRKNPDFFMFKWLDWTASMKMDIKMQLIPCVKDNFSENDLFAIFEGLMKSLRYLSKSITVSERVEELMIRIEKMEKNYLL